MEYLLFCVRLLSQRPAGRHMVLLRVIVLGQDACVRLHVPSCEYALTCFLIPRWMAIWIVSRLALLVSALW